VERKHIFLSVAQLVALREVCEASGLSLAEVIRRAIDEFLERRIRKATNQGKKP
jgi:hypothetical protein